MLTNLIEVEKQLTQRRLEAETTIKDIRKLQADLKALKLAQESKTEIVSSTEGSLDSSIIADTVYHKLKHYFRKVVTFVADLLPGADNVVEIGATGSRFKKIWCYDIAVTNLDADRILLGGSTVVDDVNLKWTGTILRFGHSLTYTSNSVFFHGSGGTDRNILFFPALVLANGVQICVANDAVSVVKGLELAASDIMIGTASINIGFHGATPAAKQTLNAYTSDGESAAYTGLATALGGTPYAAVADLNQLRVAYETLRASYDDLRTKLKTTTLVG